MKPIRTINVYLAANAVMYLPFYLAQEKGVFSTLLPDVRVNLFPCNGDKDALEKMQVDNLSTDQTICAIAVADPCVTDQQEDVQIIASLIDRLSFWAVSTSDYDISLASRKINNKYDTLVYYDNNLITGNKVGVHFFNKEQIRSQVLISNLGEEFNYLNAKTLIITPDLLNIAIRKVQSNLMINYHFAKGDKYLPNDYITTAIITDKCSLENDKVYPVLICIIEAIQKAKSIIYSSKTIAIEILENMSCMTSLQLENDEKNRIAQTIIEIIHEDRIYPNDMNISIDKWEKTIGTKNGFDALVNTELVLNAEKKIANQFGITPHGTFAEELLPLQKSIEQLQKTNTELCEKIDKLSTPAWKRWLSKHKTTVSITLFIVIYGLIYLIALCKNYVWVNHGLAKTPFSAILGIFWDVFVKNKVQNEKNS